MKSGQKKKKINKAEVIGKGLLTVLLIALELAIWPGYLVYNNYMSSSYSEYSVYSEPITERTEITQYFKPLYSGLDQIEFALGFEQEAVTDQVLHFVLYDEKNTELMSQDFPLGRMSADHFYALPLGGVTFRKTDISLDAYNTGSRRMQYPVYVCGTWKRCGPGEYTS